MHKQVPTVEWQVFENDEEWARLSPLPVAENKLLLPSTTQPAWLCNPFSRVMVLLLLFLVNIGGWWWHTNHQPAALSIPQALCATTFTQRDNSPTASTPTARPGSNTLTVAELLANQRAYAEYRATVAGLGHFAEPYPSNVSPAPPPLAP